MENTRDRGFRLVIHPANLRVFWVDVAVEYRAVCLAQQAFGSLRSCGDPTGSTGKTAVKQPPSLMVGTDDKGAAGGT